MPPGRCILLTVCTSMVVAPDWLTVARGRRLCGSPSSRKADPNARLPQRLQRRRLAFWQRHAIDVQYHRYQAVISHRTDQIDHPTLAEPVGDPLEAGVRYV